MPRKPRFVLPGYTQHGNYREPCFFADDDYRSVQCHAIREALN